MEQYVLRTLDLTKRFRAKTVVDHLNISIRRGDIYGFIGPNGAGKTTAMKVVLGMLTPTSGTFELFGQPQNQKALRRVGSLIESPGLYTDCTAWENMKRFSILSGGTDVEIQNILGLVGLLEVGKKKVKYFSLGMKQRLGIAISLLGNPEMLILDEPVNGLDPMGMKDVRDTILRINREMGVTFFISSHLLGELEKISTVYGIINKGILTEQITAEELSRLCVRSIRLRCSEPPAAADIIRQTFGIQKIMFTGDGLEVGADPSFAAELNKTLVMSGISVMELTTKSMSYEDYFLNKMGMYDVGGGVGQYV